MAVITDLGNNSNYKGIMQPKLKNRFLITFVGLGDSPVDGQGLQIQAVTAERPKVSFETINLDRYNTRAYIAGKYTFDPLNMTFEDDTGGMVATALQNQLERQQNLIAQTPSALMPASPAGELYKFATRIDILDGNETVLESWSVEGCWLENLDYTDLDYAASEQMKINATIRYDHARQRITGIGYKANPSFGAF